jgi:hypothetical protein
MHKCLEWMGRRVPCPASALLIATASCTEAPPSTDPSTVVDWELVGPNVSLGSRDGEHDAFSPISDVVVGPEGSLNVLLRQEDCVKVFSWEGIYTGTIGRSGNGPGEFDRPVGLGFVGDTLWVLDRNVRQVSFFLHGVFLGRQPYPDMDGWHEEREARVGGVVSGLRQIVATDVVSAGQPLEAGSLSQVILFDGERATPLANINTNHIGGFLFKRSGLEIREVRVFRQPFSDSSIWEISREGDAFFVLDRPVYDGVGDPVYRLTRIDLSGDTVFSIEVPYEPTPIRASVVDSTISHLATPPFSTDEARDGLFLPHYYPPATRLLDGTDGTIWVERRTPPGEDHLWDVFSSLGLLIATARVAPEVELRVVGRPEVWGITKDEYDVPFLHRFKVIESDR